MKYFLSARSEKEASDYFYVLPDSGDVILSKPLSESKKTMFTVSRTCLLIRILVGVGIATFQPFNFHFSP